MVACCSEQAQLRQSQNIVPAKQGRYRIQRMRHWMLLAAMSVSALKKFRLSRRKPSQTHEMRQRVPAWCRDALPWPSICLRMHPTMEPLEQRMSRNMLSARSLVQYTQHRRHNKSRSLTYSWGSLTRIQERKPSQVRPDQSSGRLKVQNVQMGPFRLGRGRERYQDSHKWQASCGTIVV